MIEFVWTFVKLDVVLLCSYLYPIRYIGLYRLVRASSWSNDYRPLSVSSVGLVMNVKTENPGWFRFCFCVRS